MASEKRLIDANGSYTLNECNETGHSLCFGGGFIDVYDQKGKHICQFWAGDAPTVDAVEVPTEDYFVLRNTETGLYFRGKGANRWGKHFNQATIYRVKGTAEHSIKDVAWHGEKAEMVRIKIIEVGERKDNG